MKICLFVWVLLGFTNACQASPQSGRAGDTSTRSGVRILRKDSLRDQMPVRKPYADTSMNMPVVPPRPGIVPK
jgi:hypothetical protein